MYIVRGSFPLRKIFYRKGYFKMMNLKDKEVMLRELWESEKGIKSAFHNACDMYFILSQHKEEEGYDEYRENPYLDMLWGAIVGVLSASAINQYSELDFNYDGTTIWVSVYDYDSYSSIIIDSHNKGDRWVDTYKIANYDYWDMSRY